MSDDWQVGDLALCVAAQDDGWGVPESLRVGGVYTVARVFSGVGINHVRETGLALDGISPCAPRAIGFAARAFRKIRPHTPDAEDRETIDLMLSPPIHEIAGV